MRCHLCSLVRGGCSEHYLWHSDTWEKECPCSHRREHGSHRFWTQWHQTVALKRVYTDPPLTHRSCLSELAIRDAVSRAAVFISPQIKLDSQLSHCAFFFFFFKSTPFGAAPQSDLRGSLPGYSPQWGSRLKRISRLSFHFSLHYPLPWREVFGASGKHGWQNWASKRFGKCWSWWEDKREWGILTKEEPVAAPNVRTWSGHGVKAAPSHFAVQQALFPTSSLSARAIEVRMHWSMIRK